MDKIYSREKQTVSTCIVDHGWNDIRLPWLDIVLFCMDGVWTEVSVRYLDKPWCRDVKIKSGWKRIYIYGSTGNNDIGSIAGEKLVQKSKNYLHAKWRKNWRREWCKNIFEIYSAEYLEGNFGRNYWKIVRHMWPKVWHQIVCRNLQSNIHNNCSKKFTKGTHKETQNKQK